LDGRTAGTASTVNDLDGDPEHDNLTSSPEGAGPYCEPEEDIAGHTEAIRRNLTREIDRSAPSADAVHEALKGPELGFKFEAAGLEKEARRLAHAWAERGLPRHDLERGRPVEAEVVLAQRAGEIYAGWIRRVRQKVDAAIAMHSGLLERASENGWRTLETYRNAEQTLHELAPRAASVDAAPIPSESQPAPLETSSVTTSEVAVQPVSGEQENDTRRETGPVRLATREFHRGFWPLTITLVLAEFVANAPVFTELFPVAAEIEERVRSTTSSDASIYVLGLHHVTARLFASPEPAFLALAIVAIFLFLGHHLGGQYRSVVALRSPLSDVAPELVTRVRRQARVACRAAALGVLVMLVMLFAVRTKAAPMASERLEAANRQVAALKQALDNAEAEKDRGAIVELREALYDAQDQRDYRVARMDYAVSINSVNIPIAGMNFALVIVAALAGYFRQELELPRRSIVSATDTPAAAVPVPVAGESLQAEREAGLLARSKCATTEAPSGERLNELRDVMRTSRQALESIIAEGDRAYFAAKQLLHCNPTAKWEGIVDRLACAVPLFRAENALARKLDPHDIEAFRQSPSLALGAPDDRPLRVDLLEALESTYDRLRALRDAASAITRPGRSGDRISDSRLAEGLS
jgi:hypothetical protein